MSDQNSSGPGGGPRKGHKGSPGDREREREALRGRFEPEPTPEPEYEAMPEPEGPTEIIKTDFEIGQDNIEGKVPFPFDIHNPVFGISAIAVVLFTFGTVILSFITASPPIDGVAQPSGVEVAFTGLRDALTGNLDWLFLSAGNIFVLLCLFLIVSPYGKIRLGGPDATPDFSMTGWFSMLFAAGMGIGLMFYGVAEPLGHYEAAFGSPVVGEDGVRTDWAPLDGAAGDEQAARRLGMAATIFHWGLHPWAIYAVVALSLALFAFNKGLPLTLRSVFYPIFGEAVWGWPGHIIDVLAVLATLFGLATSLGIGAEQAGAGLNFLFGWGSTTTAKMILIAVITLVATMSVVLGVEKGVKRISELNMILAIILLLFVLIVGPTMSIITGFFGNLGAYAKEIIPLSNPTVESVWS